MTFIIAVGSQNPVKAAAIKAVLSIVFPNAGFVSVPVSSNIPDQPWGDDQTRRGAFNRATAALLKAEADLGVGLEGGLIKTVDGIMTCAWGAIVDPAGRVGYGGGVHLLLPPQVIEFLEKKGELGPAMDLLVDEHNTKQGRGAVGILTNGLLDRQRAYEQLVAMAAAPFVTEYYHD